MNINMQKVKVYPEQRENFIQEYIPFIIKVISKILNRYIDIDNDDEFSIGLIAFNEAIDRYDENKGNFFSFAELIIRSRIIDYIRKEKKPIMIDYDEGLLTNECDKQKNMQDNYLLKEEINILQKELKKFKIHLNELPECSPKQNSTIIKCKEVANIVLSNLLLKESLFRKRKLPSTSLNKKYGYSKKFLKLYRKYIIAEILINDCSLDLIKEWTYSEGGKENVL